jgi:hypothetical protein
MAHGVLQASAASTRKLGRSSQHPLNGSIIGEFQPEERHGYATPSETYIAQLVMREATFFVILGLLLLSSSVGAFANGVVQPGAKIEFDIPVQPLAAALEAYGAASDIQMFYDAALAAGHKSTAVEGLLTPEEALAVLLQGTGYVGRTMAPGVVSIEIAPKPLELPPIPPDSALNPYEAYFAVVQGRLSEALCSTGDATPANSKIVFKFWLTAFGLITHVDLIGGTGDAAHDRAIVTRLEGFNIGVAPPADLPEPIIMAIYPPAPGETLGCAGQ